MTCKSVVYVFATLLTVINTQRESCVTPLGAQSQCINLYKCPQLLIAFAEVPVPIHLTSFLRSSSCGFEGSDPKVCCGPLPSSRNTPSPTQKRSTDRNRDYMGTLDPNNREDSQPSPRGRCGIDTNRNRIYSGNATDLDEFPWMALLCFRTKSGKNSCQCGGVLINQRYVLTAAHCLVGAVEKEVGELISVRLGEYNLNTAVDCMDGSCADPPQDIPVQEKYPHPNYVDGNKDRDGDIGLVRLARRVKLSYYVQPICLVNRDESTLNVGTNLFIAGWGKTLQGTNSVVKLKLKMPVFDKNQCANKYRTLGAELTENQICAGGNFAQSACRGDSGGPLMISKADGIWESVGVISFGYGCGRDGWPGVYTSVAGYKDWILNTLRSTNA